MTRNRLKPNRIQAAAALAIVATASPLTWQFSTRSRATAHAATLGRAAVTRPQVRPPVSERAELKDILTETESDLKDDVLPFWTRETWDDQGGGFNTNVDRYGHPNDDTDKRIIMQGRMLWFLSAACRAGYGTEKYRSLADKCFNFMTTKMWDTDNGGFYFSVHRDGSPADTTKLVYAQAFALYGLSEYARLTKKPEALAWAYKVYGVVESKAADGNLGYLEDFDRDWKPRHTASMGGGGDDSEKSLNTHMHYMEALTNLVLASPTPQHKASLKRIVHLILTKVPNHKYGCAMEPFDRDWKPLANPKGQYSTPYGHEMETAWLLMDAVRALGSDPKSITDPVVTWTDHALKNGFDQENGGFATYGPYEGYVKDDPDFAPGADNKDWWEQAEASIDLIEVYQLTGNKKYLDAFRKQWGFISKYLIDRDGGDWFKSVDWNTGRPLQLDKGYGGWKAAYHNGRCLLRVTRDLKQILGER